MAHLARFIAEWFFITRWISLFQLEELSLCFYWWMEKKLIETCRLNWNNNNFFHLCVVCQLIDTIENEDESNFHEKECQPNMSKSLTNSLFQLNYDTITYHNYITNKLKKTNANLISTHFLNWVQSEPNPKQKFREKTKSGNFIGQVKNGQNPCPCGEMVEG